MAAMPEAGTRRVSTVTSPRSAYARIPALRAARVTPELIDRTPDLHLAGDPVHRPSFSIRGLTSLPLAWTPG